MREYIPHLYIRIYRKVSVYKAAGAFFAGAKCLKFITFVWHFYAGCEAAAPAQLVSWLPGAGAGVAAATVCSRLAGCLF